MNASVELPPESKRILIVDDEPIVLTALRETLRTEGYDVTAVSSPLEAFDIIQDNRFSVILTDQQMPVLTGLEFLGQAKEIQPDAVRILITAVLSLNTVVDAINKGEIYRFIVKPWLREELLVTVRNAVQRYDLIVHNQELRRQAEQANTRLAQQLAASDLQREELERLNVTLAANLERSLQICVKALETFYPAIGERSKKALEICRAMGGEPSLSPQQQRTLELAASLHGIGLIGVPRRLLSKWIEAPESLTEQERLTLENYPIKGQEMVSLGDELSAVGHVIRSHCERWDGHGYPDRRRGTDIDRLARLLAVVVGYASNSHNQHHALEAIRSQSGTAFDPEAVQVFLRCLPKAVVSKNPREVVLSDLRPGMVLAAGIYNAKGLLLIAEGQVLDPGKIEKIKTQSQVSAIRSLRVYC